MINNTFSHKEGLERKGSDVDVKNLKDLFHQLHFEVVTKTDLLAQVRTTVEYLFHVMF